MVLKKKFNFSISTIITDNMQDSVFKLNSLLPVFPFMHTTEKFETANTEKIFIFSFSETAKCCLECKDLVI